MISVATCLWLGPDVEAAVTFYASLLPSSRVERVLHAPGPWPGGPGGEPILVEFTLAGQRYQGLNGARTADFGMAASIVVTCPDQAEVDRLWTALTADGGAEIMCGWLRDRWDVPWQIVPEVLPRLLHDPDPVVAGRAFAAMQEMVKLDVAEMERSARSLSS